MRARLFFVLSQNFPVFFEILSKVPVTQKTKCSPQVSFIWALLRTNSQDAILKLMAISANKCVKLWLIKCACRLHAV